MEQIVRRDGTIYYGDTACRNAGEAYMLFRDDYHRELGKKVYRRLGSRARHERVHGYKSYYSESRSRYLADKFDGYSRVKCWQMGIVGISYCHAIGSWYMPWFDSEDDLDDFIDWLLDVKSNAIRVIGKKIKTGRTGKKRKRYR